jgi:hypothetical protein
MARTLGLVKVKVTLRPTTSRSVSAGLKALTEDSSYIASGPDPKENTS